MKIALLQCNALSHSPKENAVKIHEAARKAKAAGADLCVTQELALSGCPPADLLLRDAFIKLCQEVVQEMAHSFAAEGLPPLLLGTPVLNPAPQGKPLHNCAVLLREGKPIVISRKVLLPSDGSQDDHHYFESGVACGVLQFKGWRFGVAVGEDVWNDRGFWRGRREFDNDPVEEFMGGGADALLNLTAIRYFTGGPELHRRLLAWTAAKYRVPVACVNQVGCTDGHLYEGGSMVFNAAGALIAKAAMFAEDVLVVDLRKDKPAHLPAPLKAEDELWQALVMGVRDFTLKSGFNRVVLGLSGGLDSALVAAIAAEALGPKNVLGLLLPSPYSSKGSVEDSLTLAANLGIMTQTIPIAEAMRVYDQLLRPAFAGHKSSVDDVTEENIQARIRGNILMAFSNKFGRLLLNTGNKSELAVGYCTMYGDMVGGLAVIGDLYKTQVYVQARALNQRHGRDLIPAAILEKAPSAELRPGQKDLDSLPPYDLLDAVLYSHLEERQDVNGLVEQGYDPALVHKVVRLVRRSEYKRHQAPPALHVSSRPFGNGWHMPLVFKSL